MATLSMLQNPNHHHPSTHLPFSTHNHHPPPPKMSLHSNPTRRTTTLHIIFTNILLPQSISAMFDANQVADAAFDFRMTTPEQTLEEAESGIGSHAQSLLSVKELLEAESWKEAQKLLRKSSSYLKQDIYTIIQAKPGTERPQLRKLYSNLFNGVSRLDYAARDKDPRRVWECYDNVVVALNDILSKIIANTSIDMTRVMDGF